MLWPHEYTHPVTSRWQNFIEPLPPLCLLYFLKIYFVVNLCLCACLPPVYACMHKPEESVMPPWAGITESSELPNMGAGNQTLDPLREHKHSYPTSHLFSPQLLHSFSSLFYNVPWDFLIQGLALGNHLFSALWPATDVSITTFCISESLIHPTWARPQLQCFSVQQ